MANSRPIGNYCLPSLSRERRNVAYRVFILLLTFVVYTSYHMAKKPVSVVKNVLHRNCSTPISKGMWYDIAPSSNNTNFCDWPPFENGNYKELLGSLDLAFLFSYAFGMFFSGHFAERMNLRYFLSGGMILVGITTGAFGMGYFLEIHSIYYYIIVQILSGLVQSTGWPSVVSCVGNWYGKGKRGLIMGIWNSHTSVGNITGSLIAGAFVATSWGWSFLLPGLIMIGVGIIVFLFLVPDPADVGCDMPDQHGDHVVSEHKPREHVLNVDSPDTDDIKKIDLSTISITIPEEKIAYTINNNEMTNKTALNGHVSDLNGHVTDHKMTNGIHPNAATNTIITNGHVTDPKKSVVAGTNGVVSNGVKVGKPETPLQRYDVSSSEEEYMEQSYNSMDGSTVALIKHKQEKPITIFGAILIPGVVEFSLCLFCAKLVSYTFLFWLPNYIEHTAHYDAEKSADISTLFDVGGIVGGILAGVISDNFGGRASTCAVMLIAAAPVVSLYVCGIVGGILAGVISDKFGGRASTCAVMLVAAAPVMYVYNLYGSINLAHSIGLSFLCGALVNGPYALITTAVSADLGTHKMLEGNSKALATVTAVIDGTGSIGAAIGPLLAGLIPNWNDVFIMLIISDLCALIFLVRLVYKELRIGRLFGCTED